MPLNFSYGLLSRCRVALLIIVVFHATNVAIVHAQSVSVRLQSNKSTSQDYCISSGASVATLTDIQFDASATGILTLEASASKYSNTVSIGQGFTGSWQNAPTDIKVKAYDTLTATLSANTSNKAEIFIRPHYDAYWQNNVPDATNIRVWVMDSINVKLSTTVREIYDPSNVVFPVTATGFKVGPKDIGQEMDVYSGAVDPTEGLEGRLTTLNAQASSLLDTLSHVISPLIPSDNTIAAHFTNHQALNQLPDAGDHYIYARIYANQVPSTISTHKGWNKLGVGCVADPNGDLYSDTLYIRSNFSNVFKTQSPNEKLVRVNFLPTHKLFATSSDQFCADATTGKFSADVTVKFPLLAKNNKAFHAFYVNNKQQTCSRFSETDTSYTCTLDKLKAGDSVTASLDVFNDSYTTRALYFYDSRHKYWQGGGSAASLLTARDETTDGIARYALVFERFRLRSADSVLCVAEGGSRTFQLHIIDSALLPSGSTVKWATDPSTANVVLTPSSTYTHQVEVPSSFSGYVALYASVAPPSCASSSSSFGTDTVHLADAANMPSPFNAQRADSTVVKFRVVPSSAFRIRTKDIADSLICTQQPYDLELGAFSLGHAGGAWKLEWRSAANNKPLSGTNRGTTYTYNTANIIGDGDSVYLQLLASDYYCTPNNSGGFRSNTIQIGNSDYLPNFLTRRADSTFVKTFVKTHLGPASSGDTVVCTTQTPIFGISGSFKAYPYPGHAVYQWRSAIGTGANLTGSGNTTNQYTYAHPSSGGGDSIYLQVTLPGGLKGTCELRSDTIAIGDSTFWKNNFGSIPANNKNIKVLRAEDISFVSLSGFNYCAGDSIRFTLRSPIKGLTSKFFIGTTQGNYQLSNDSVFVLGKTYSTQNDVSNNPRLRLELSKGSCTIDNNISVKSYTAGGEVGFLSDTLRVRYFTSDGERGNVKPSQDTLFCTPYTLSSVGVENTGGYEKTTTDIRRLWKLGSKAILDTSAVGTLKNRVLSAGDLIRVELYPTGYPNLSCVVSSDTLAVYASTDPRFTSQATGRDVTTRKYYLSLEDTAFGISAADSLVCIGSTIDLKTQGNFPSGTTFQWHSAITKSKLTGVGNTTSVYPYDPSFGDGDSVYLEAELPNGLSGTCVLRSDTVAIGNSAFWKNNFGSIPANYKNIKVLRESDISFVSLSGFNYCAGDSIRFTLRSPIKGLTSKFFIGTTQGNYQLSNDSVFVLGKTYSTQNDVSNNPRLRLELSKGSCTIDNNISVKSYTAGGEVGFLSDTLRVRYFTSDGERGNVKPSQDTLFCTPYTLSSVDVENTGGYEKTTTDIRRLWKLGSKTILDTSAVGTLKNHELSAGDLIRVELYPTGYPNLSCVVSSDTLAVYASTDPRFASQATGRDVTTRKYYFSLETLPFKVSSSGADSVVCSGDVKFKKQGNFPSGTTFQWHSAITKSKLTGVGNNTQTYTYDIASSGNGDSIYLEAELPNGLSGTCVLRSDTVAIGNSAFWKNNFGSIPADNKNIKVLRKSDISFASSSGFNYCADDSIRFTLRSPLKGLTSNFLTGSARGFHRFLDDSVVVLGKTYSTQNDVRAIPFLRLELNKGSCTIDNDILVKSYTVGGEVGFLSDTLRVRYFTSDGARGNVKPSQDTLFCTPYTLSSVDVENTGGYEKTTTDIRRLWKLGSKTILDTSAVGILKNRVLSAGDSIRVELYPTGYPNISCVVSSDMLVVYASTDTRFAGLGTGKNTTTGEYYLSLEDTTFCISTADSLVCIGSTIALKTQRNFPGGTTFQWRSARTGAALTGAGSTTRTFMYDATGSDSVYLEAVLPTCTMRSTTLGFYLTGDTVFSANVADTIKRVRVLQSKDFYLVPLLQSNDVCDNTAVLEIGGIGESRGRTGALTRYSNYQFFKGTVLQTGTSFPFTWSFSGSADTMLYATLSGSNICPINTDSVRVRKHYLGSTWGLSTNGTGYIVRKWDRDSLKGHLVSSIVEACEGSSFTHDIGVTKTNYGTAPNLVDFSWSKNGVIELSVTDETRSGISYTPISAADTNTLRFRTVNVAGVAAGCSVNSDTLAMRYATNSVFGTNYTSDTLIRIHPFRPSIVASDSMLCSYTNTGNVVLYPKPTTYDVPGTTYQWSMIGKGGGSPISLSGQTNDSCTVASFADSARYYFTKSISGIANCAVVNSDTIQVVPFYKGLGTVSAKLLHVYKFDTLMISGLDSLWCIPLSSSPAVEFRIGVNYAQPANTAYTWTSSSSFTALGTDSIKVTIASKDTNNMSASLTAVVTPRAKLTCPNQLSNTLSMQRADDAYFVSNKPDLQHIKLIGNSQLQLLNTPYEYCNSTREAPIYFENTASSNGFQYDIAYGASGSVRRPLLRTPNGDKLRDTSTFLGFNIFADSLDRDGTDAGFVRIYAKRLSVNSEPSCQLSFDITRKSHLNITSDVGNINTTAFNNALSYYFRVWNLEKGLVDPDRYAVFCLPDSVNFRLTGVRLPGASGTLLHQWKKANTGGIATNIGTTPQSTTNATMGSIAYQGIKIAVGDTIYAETSPSVLPACKVQSDSTIIYKNGNPAFAGTTPSRTRINLDPKTSFDVVANDSLVCSGSKISLFTRETFPGTTTPDMQWKSQKQGNIGTGTSVSYTVKDEEDSLYLVVNAPKCTVYSDTVRILSAYHPYFKSSRMDTNVLKLAGDKDSLITPNALEWCGRTGASISIHTQTYSSDNSLFKGTDAFGTPLASTSGSFVHNTASADTAFATITFYSKSGQQCVIRSNSISFISNAGSRFSTTSQPGWKADEKSFTTRVWDSIKGSLQAGIQELCTSHSHVTGKLKNYSRGYEPSQVDIEWRRNGAMLSNQTTVADSVAELRTNLGKADTVYAISTVSSSILSGCSFRSDSLVILNNDNLIFGSKKPGQNLVRHSVVVPKIIPRNVEDTVICVGGSYTFMVNYLNTGDAGKYDHTWYKNNVVQTSTTRGQIRLSNLQSGDSIGLLLSLSNVNNACDLQSPSAAILSNTNSIFATQRADSNRIKILDNIGVDIKANVASICALGTGSSSATYRVNRYDNIVPSRIGAYSWNVNRSVVGGGATANTYTRTSHARNDSVFLEITTDTKTGSCSFSSDTIAVLSNAYFIKHRTQPDSTSRLQLYDSLVLKVVFKPAAGGAYRYCAGAGVQAFVSDSVGDYDQYTWHRIRKGLDQTIAVSTISLTQLADVQELDSFYIEGKNTVGCVFNSDTISVLPSKSKLTENDKTIRVGAYGSLGTITRLVSLDSTFCQQDSLTLKLDNRNVNDTTYTWRLLRSGMTYDLFVDTVSRFTYKGANYSALGHLQANDMLVVGVKDGLGCTANTDTVRIYGILDANKPTKSNKNVYVLDNFNFTVDADKSEICIKQDLLLKSTLSFAKSLVASRQWKNVGGSLIPAGTGISDTLQLTNIQQDGTYWLELTIADGASRCTAVSADSVRIEVPGLRAFTPSSKRVALYTIMTGEVQASAAQVCKDSSLSISLSNTQGNPDEARWTKRDVTGTRTTLGVSSPSSPFKVSNLKHGDTIYAVVSNQKNLGCVSGYSDTLIVVSDTLLNTLPTNRKGVVLYDTVTGALRTLDKQNGTEISELCADQSFVVELQNMKGDVANNTKGYSFYKSIAGVQTDEVSILTPPSVNQYSSKDFQRGGEVWVKLTNPYGCVGYSDTVRFYNVIPTPNNTKNVFVKGSNGVGTIISPNKVYSYCPAVGGVANVVMVFTTSYKNINNIKWINTRNLSTPLGNADTLKLQAGVDVLAGDTIYVEFDDGTCSYRSDTILFTSSNIANAKTWQIIKLADVKLEATATRFCLGNSLIARLKNIPPITDSIVWKWRRKGSAAVAVKRSNYSDTQYIRSDYQHGDSLWAEVSTNTAGCSLVSDTLVISNTSNSPTVKYPRLYDTINAKIKVINDSNEYCTGANISFDVNNFKGNVNTVIFYSTTNRSSSLRTVKSATVLSSLPATSLTGLKVGDTVYAQVKNATGCVGYTDSIPIISNTQTLIAGKKMIVMYDDVKLSVNSLDTAICLDDSAALTFAYNANDTLNRLPGGFVKSVLWRMNRGGIWTSMTGNTSPVVRKFAVRSGDVYTATITNVLGCVFKTIDSVKFSTTITKPTFKNVLIHPLSAQISASTSKLINAFCEGDTVSFKFSTLIKSNSTTISDYNWKHRRAGVISPFGSNYDTASLSDLQGGDIVWCEFKNDLGCKANTDTITVSTTGSSSRKNIILQNVQGLILNAPDVSCVKGTLRYSVDTIPKGTPNLSFKWYEQKSGATAKQIAGASTSTLNKSYAAGDKIWVQYSQQGCPALYTDTVFHISNATTPTKGRKEVTIYDSVNVQLKVSVKDAGGTYTLLSGVDRAFCKNDVVRFEVQPPTGITFDTYKWYKGNVAQTKATSASFTDTFQRPVDSVYCEATMSSSAMSGLTCKIKSQTLYVKNSQNLSTPRASDELQLLDYTKGNLSVSDTAFCLGSPVTFSVVPEASSDTIKSYRWVLNRKPTTTTATYTSSKLVNGDSIWCELYNTKGCLYYSDTIAVTNALTKLQKAIRIYDLQKTKVQYPKAICVGASDTFQTPDLKAKDIKYVEWYVGSKRYTPAGNKTYEFTVSGLQDGNIVFAKYLEGTCTQEFSSDTVFVISSTKKSTKPYQTVIYDNIKATVTISKSAICSDDTDTFSLINLAAGISKYVWKKKTGTVVKDVGTLSSKYVANNLARGDTLRGGDTVYAELLHGTSGCTANTVMIPIISNATASGKIGVFDKPDYRINTTRFREPASRQFCEGDSLTFKLERLSGNATNTFQWNINKQTLFRQTYDSFSTNNFGIGDSISATVSNTACRKEIKAVEIVSTPLTSADSTKARLRFINRDVVVPSTTMFCVGSPPVVFEARNVGDGTFFYQWTYTNVVKGTTVTGSHSPIYKVDTLTHRDRVSVIITNEIGCKQTSNEIEAVLGVPAKNQIRVASLNSLSIHIAPSQNVLCLATPTLTASVVTPQAADIASYDWFVNGVKQSNNQVFQQNVNVGDTIFARIKGTTGCTGTSDSITVVSTTPQGNQVQLVDFTVQPNVVTVVDAFCKGSRIPFTLRNTGGGDYSYRWFISGVLSGTDSLFITSTLSAGDEVWAELVNSAGCVASSDTIQVIANRAPTNSKEIRIVLGCKVSVGKIPTILRPLDKVIITYSSDLLSSLQNVEKYFEVELSDPLGSFANPTKLGKQLRRELAGSLEVTIPFDVLSGCRYRIRVIIRNVDLGADSYFPSDDDITIVNEKELTERFFVGYDAGKASSFITQGKSGIGHEMKVQTRGCDMRFELLSKQSGISVDPFTGRIIWDSTIPFKNYDLLVRLNTTFEQYLPLNKVATYSLVAYIRKYNLQLYPNPIVTEQGALRVGFDLSQFERMRIRILDEAGRLVFTLPTKEYPAGNWVEFVNIQTLTPGMYVLLLDAEGGETVAQQFMIVK